MVATEQMHRTAAAPSATFGFAVHFSQNTAHRNASGQRMAVFAVGGNDPVLVGEQGNDACSYSLFAVVEVQKPPDLLLRI